MQQIVRISEGPGLVWTAGMEQFFTDIGNAYQHGIIDTGRQPALILLVSFLCTFGFIRTSAHLIKKGVSWWPGNVNTKSGLHIHHMVWGIILMMVVGYISIGIHPPPPGGEILAVFFGIGMGLTLDEFALWLNLDDVYWTKKGRESIDAVIIAATLLGLLLLGLHFWVDVIQAEIRDLIRIGEVPGETAGNTAVFVITQLAGLGFAAICFLKRKIFVGVFGLFIPLVALIGAVRLAKPNSRWAKQRYGEQKMARSVARFPEEGNSDGKAEETQAA